MENVKAEIEKVISKLPENQLIQALDYLNDLASLSAQDNLASEHLSKIMSEDDNLLKRLAQ